MIGKALLFLGSFLVGYTLEHENAPKLTLRECIDIAAEYEIFHPYVPQQVDWYGLSDIDGQKLFVIRNTALANRRKAMIHEMLHISAHFDGLTLTQNEEEEAVRIKADALYLELFVK